MDPNKYKQNVDTKADTPLQNLMSVGSMALVLAGIVGLALEFFKEDGLVGKIVGFFFKSTGTMLLLPVACFALWLLNRWISAAKPGETKKAGNLPMYFMMAMGAYTIFQYTLGA